LLFGLLPITANLVTDLVPTSFPEFVKLHATVLVIFYDASEDSTQASKAVEAAAQKMNGETNPSRFAKIFSGKGSAGTSVLLERLGIFAERKPHV